MLSLFSLGITYLFSSSNFSWHYAGTTTSSFGENKNVGLEPTTFRSRAWRSTTEPCPYRTCVLLWQTKKKHRVHDGMIRRKKRKRKGGRGDQFVWS